MSDPEVNQVQEPEMVDAVDAVDAVSLEVPDIPPPVPSRPSTPTNVGMFDTPRPPSVATTRDTLLADSLATPRIPLSPAPPNYTATIDHDSRLDRLGDELAPDSTIWTTYMNAARTYDSNMVDNWNKGLDVLLIFASLFSAVVTAFIVESSKLLQPDYTQINALLTAHLLTMLANDNNATASSILSAVPSPSAILAFKKPASAEAVNIMWYAALGLSLASVLVAMLAKQWLSSYVPEEQADPYELSCERQRRYDGLHSWALPNVMTILPALLHASLFLFLIGLIAYMWQLDAAISGLTLIILGLLFFTYFATGTLAIFSASCPYSTPLSQFIRTGLYPSATTASPNDKLASRAILWLAAEKNPTAAKAALQSLAGLRRGSVGCSAEKSEYLAKQALECLRGCFIREWREAGAYALRTEMLYEASCYSRAVISIIDDPDCSPLAFDLVQKDEALPTLLKLLAGSTDRSIALLASCSHQRLLHHIELTKWLSLRHLDKTIGHDSNNQAGWAIHREASAENMTKCLVLLGKYLKGEIFLHPYSVQTAVETMRMCPIAWADVCARDAPVEKMLLPLLRLQDATQQGRLAGIRQELALTFATLAAVHGVERCVDGAVDFANRFEQAVGTIESVYTGEQSEEVTRKQLLTGLAHFAGSNLQGNGELRPALVFKPLFDEVDRRTGLEDPWFSDSAAVEALLPLLSLSHIEDQYKEKVLEHLQATATSAASGLDVPEDSVLHRITPRDPFPSETVQRILFTVEANKERTVEWLSDLAVLLSMLARGSNHSNQLLLEAAHVGSLVTTVATEGVACSLFWVMTRAIRHAISDSSTFELGASAAAEMNEILISYDQKYGMVRADVEDWLNIIRLIPLKSQESSIARYNLAYTLHSNLSQRDPARLSTLQVQRDALVGPSVQENESDSALRRLYDQNHSYLETPMSTSMQMQEVGYEYPPNTLLPTHQV